MEQVAGTCRKNSNWYEFVGVVAGTLRLDFEAKLASSHDVTCPRDLTQGLVAGSTSKLESTSKLVCNDLKNGEKKEKSSAAYHVKWINTFFLEMFLAKIKIIS